MGAYTLLQDLTVSSNSTSVVLNNFGTITKDDFVKVVFTHVNGSALETTIQIFPNTSAGVSGFNTGTNYHNQLLLGNGSSVVAVRPTGASCLFTPGNQTSANIGYIKISENDRYNSFFNNSVSTNNTIGNAFRYATSSGLTFNDPVTSLTFTGNRTDGIGTGSRIQIYRLDAEKVADITVTSNTTQVDISNLSIDKDSEYLLVSDILNAITNDNATVFIRVNDIASTYHNQLIFGDGSSAGAGRTTDSRYLFMSANNRSLAYSHIKLSNIGSFTAQSYNLPNTGLSTLFIRNNFTSSLAENITSITKINIVSAETNAIKAGSRFTLYKLYE